ncbi:MAG: isochorismatase family protein [Tepidisphaeraceae bacterium]
MTNLNFDRATTALLVIDPYNDFISEGGKVWNRLKAVAEANDCVPNRLQVLNAARRAELRIFYALHHRYRPGDYENWKYIAPIQKAAWLHKTFEDGTWGGEIRSEFTPQTGEIVAQEHWCSSGFANTDLDLLLKKHGVQYNTLTVVNRLVGDRPTEVYEFLKDNGSKFMQFIPLVERVGSTPEAFAEPPLLKVLAPYAEVTPWSVLPEQFGNFICEIFNRWVRRDVGKIFVQLFDVQLGIECGLGSTLCVFAETCGRAMALEHNGDLYSCDHFVYPEFKLGNIMDQTIDEMVHSPAQKQFGDDKRDALPQYCQRCEVKKYCNGECPKHRFLTTPDGEPGLNYLCAGYKKIFTHMRPHLRIMADLLRQGRPAADIMSLGLDAPCPCGSGMKFKRCCGRPTLAASHSF